MKWMSLELYHYKSNLLSVQCMYILQNPQNQLQSSDLGLHMKIRHRNEDEIELWRSWQAAEEEIALVKRSASTFQCAMCPNKFGARGSFCGHERNVLKKKWFKYQAAANHELHQVPTNTTSTSSLPSPLNDANINYSVQS